jgi:hypothetical protein
MTDATRDCTSPVCPVQGSLTIWDRQRQQTVLAEKRRQLDVAIDAIARAERSIQPGREPDWDLFKTIVREIEMQNNNEWSRKYYSEDARMKIQKGLNTMWADKEQWPAQERERFTIKPEIQEFIVRAMNATR